MYESLSKEEKKTIMKKFSTTVEGKNTFKRIKRSRILSFILMIYAIVVLALEKSDDVIHIYIFSVTFGSAIVLYMLSSIIKNKAINNFLDNSSK